MENKIKNFTDLIAWQEAHKLVLEVYKITKKFPPDEKFGLIVQLRKACISITSNIAEGFGRKSYKEKIQFYSVALGSLFEVQNQLIAARDLQYLSYVDFERINNDIIRINRIINGLIKSSPYLPHT